MMYMYNAIIRLLKFSTRFKILHLEKGSRNSMDPLVLISTCCCSKCLRRNVDKITFPTSAFIALQFYACILFLFIQGSFLPSFLPITVQLGGERNKRSSILFIWSYFRWKVVVSVVDIDGIVANYCFNFLFTIDKFWKLGHLSLILDWLMFNVDVAVFQHIYIWPSGLGSWT